MIKLLRKSSVINNEDDRIKPPIGRKSLDELIASINKLPSFMTYGKAILSNINKIYTEIITPPVPNFVGREDDLITITNWYNSETTKIGAIIGLGGEGKSSIARMWYDNLSTNETLPHIFWWGFYRNNSIDRFLNSLVIFINGEDIEIKDSWGKVDWIKRNIGIDKYLIVLDGLEEMQNSIQGEIFGKMIHAEFRELLTWLADHINGLVLITTRYPMTDINGYIGTKYENIELVGLSLDDARQLFNKAGVKGEQKNIDKIIKDYKGHALSLTLLTNALSEYFNGDIIKADEVPSFDFEDEAGGKAHIILKWYNDKLNHEQRLFMMIFSLFKRDVNNNDFNNVFRYISTFNVALNAMTELNFNKMVSNLVKLRLINKEKDNTFTAHPHIKAFYESVFPDVDKKACHKRIYEYAKTYEITPANTVTDMDPLFEQVYHGCNAGFYDEVFNDVYYDKIQRKEEGFLIYKLGAWETDLQLIKNFFPNGSLGQLPLVTNKNIQSWLINEAGISLIYTGRPQEAIAPYLKMIEIDITVSDWENTSMGYQNLTSLEYRLGMLDNSIKSARNALKMAENAKNEQYKSISKAYLGYVLFLRGEIEKPLIFFKEASEIENDISGYELYCFSGIMYVDFLTAINKTIEAFNLTTKNLEVCSEYNQVADISRCHRVLGGLKRREGKFKEAKEDLSKALNIGREISVPYLQIEAMIEQGRLFLDTEELPEVKTVIDTALPIILRTGFLLYEPVILNIQARYFKAIGEIEQSKQTAQSAFDKADKMGYHWAKIEAEIYL